MREPFFSTCNLKVSQHFTRMIVGGGVPAGGSFHAGGGMGSMGASGGGAFASGGGMRAGGPVHVSGGGDCCGGGSGAVLASGRHSGAMVGTGMGPGMGSGVTLQGNPGCGVGSGTADTGCCVGGPEASCGGVGSACFEGAGNMVTTTDWSYVGEGRGDYNKAGYNYVGEGAGSFMKETVSVPYGCRLRPCCLILLPLLLLPFLLNYLLNNSAAPTPMPTAPPAPPPPMRIPVPIPAPPAPPAPAPVAPAAPAAPAFGAFGTCIGWGDPHLRTFDGMRSDYYSSGDYYLVKSGPVNIQAQYLPTKFTNGLAVTKMVAIGGPVLKGNKLIIGPLAATWNG